MAFNDEVELNLMFLKTTWIRPDFRICVISFYCHSNTYPVGHYLLIDNAPSNFNFSTQHFLRNNRINHWKKSVKSPGMNPLELVLNDMKNYLN